MKEIESARLRYVTDNVRGIRRERRGKGFRYVLNGKTVRRATELERIRALAVPPAWTNVWISADPKSHLQATGRDARGRKQYRYHPQWRALRDETKYDRVLEFMKLMPRIRRQLRLDLARTGLPREKILAAVVKLMEKTALRVGNEEYARLNRSFGLTTLRNHHVQVRGITVRFNFRGKSGKWRSQSLEHPRLARIIKRCQEMSGYELFQYLDEDGPHRINSSDVNEYLRAITGDDFSAKDFRTWAGTVVAAEALHEIAVEFPGNRTPRKVKLAVERVAKRLGNTVTICKESYIHPAIVDAYLDGSLEVEFERRKKARRPEEAVVAAFLRRHRRRTHGH